MSKTRVATIIDDLQEYAKCGLAHNNQDWHQAYKWADELRKIVFERPLDAFYWKCNCGFLNGRCNPTVCGKCGGGKDD